jgi:hypothetical protein
METFLKSPTVPPKPIFVTPPAGTGGSHLPGVHFHLPGETFVATASESQVNSPG